MNSEELIKSITKAFFDSPNEHVSYISLPSGLMDVYKTHFGNDIQIIDLKKELTPISPFLRILSDLKISDKEIRENTYPLQYQTFVSFFQKQYHDIRKDLVVLEEIDYEKLRLRDSIITMMENNYKGKTVILNAQLMSGNAIKVLKSLENGHLQGKLIFCFNSMEMDMLPTETQVFIQSIANENNYYSINSLEDYSEHTNYQQKEEKLDLKKVYAILRSYRYFLDIEKAYEFSKEIDASNELLDADTADARQIYLEMGIIAFYYGDTDLASFFLNNVTEYQLEDEINCFALYYLAQVATKKNMNSMALKFVTKAIMKSKELEDSPVYALSMMLDYIITERTDSEYSTTKYFQVLSLLDSKNLTNNRIYTSLIIPYGIVYDKDLREKMLVQVEKARDDAERIENKFGLSIACHWMGIIMTHMGLKDKSHAWYDKSFKLRKEIGDISSIIKVTNGLAYEYLIDTKFRASYDLIGNILHYLLDMKDYPEVIVTLFNFARTCFFSRNFDIAYEIVQTILNLMGMFDISDLSGNSFLPEYNDILVYKANLDYFRGEYTRARMNLHNIINNRKPIAPIEDFLKNFLSACLELEENNKEEAISIFEEKCFNDFFKAELAQEYRIVFMCYEFAEVLNTKGFAEEAKKYMQHGLEIAKSKNLVHFTSDKEQISTKDYHEFYEEFPPLKIELSELLQHAEKDKLVNQLHKRLRDSQFLNRLTANHATNMKDQRFLTNISQSVFDYCMAESVFIAQKSDDGWDLLSKSTRENAEDPEESLWEKIILQKRCVEIKESKKSLSQKIFINLSKFEFTGGMIIYLQEKFQLNPEELNILNIAATNIQTQFVMLKQNEHLTIISATDQLSMLNNRRALQDHLLLESEMIRRYEKKRNLYLHDSISFIDLDNFKFYNDTYGHEAGDILISCFAKLLKTVYRKVDFVARFGGDEFVVVLPNTTCEEAARAAERLAEALKKADYFIPDLRTLLKKNIEVPENRHLGFSMGISSNSDGSDISDLETTMVNADKALYYSKQHKKGSVTIWSKIKDEFEDTKMIEQPER